MAIPRAFATKSFAKPAAPCILYTHAACAGHNIKQHPEQPARVPSIVEALTAAFPELPVRDQSPNVTDEQLLRFHTKRHVAAMNSAFAVAL